MNATQDLPKPSLFDVIEGDKLILISRGTNRVVTVTGATPKQIQVDRDSYWRKDGYRVGARSSGRSWSGGMIRVPKAGELEQLEAAAAQARTEAEARRLAEREALRGRTMGFLVAADEALDQAVVALGDVEEGSPEAARRKLLRVLGSQLWSLRSDLGRAEKAVKEDAGRLRRIAEELESGLKHDVARNSVWSTSALAEASRHEEERAGLVAQAQGLIAIVAATLGVNEQELIAPFAAAPESEQEQG